MTDQNESVLHKKTLEQKVEETVDRLIELEKVRPEERSLVIQALLKEHQGYLGGGDQDDQDSSEEE